MKNRFALMYVVWSNERKGMLQMGCERAKREVEEEKQNWDEALMSEI